MVSAAAAGERWRWWLPCASEPFVVAIAAATLGLRRRRRRRRSRRGGEEETIIPYSLCSPICRGAAGAGEASVRQLRRASMRLARRVIAFAGIIASGTTSKAPARRTREGVAPTAGAPLSHEGNRFHFGSATARLLASAVFVDAMRTVSSDVPRRAPRTLVHASHMRKRQRRTTLSRRRPTCRWRSEGRGHATTAQADETLSFTAHHGFRHGAEVWRTAAPHACTGRCPVRL